MQFSKYHALGNDYIVMEAAEAAGGLTAEIIGRVCARNFGLGSDGILIREPDPAPGKFHVRFINPDGSEAEKSGNGLRIFSRYLWDQGAVEAEAEFPVQTAGGQVTCKVSPAGRVVTVDMGRISFHSHDVPVTGPPREVIQEELEVNGDTLTFTAANIGNPHCVVLREELSVEETHRLGPLIETETVFPNLTNVQFLQVLDRENIRIEIWERGAGYTLASGTSSCAAAAVARRLDLCESVVAVHMPGGHLRIEISDDYLVRMTGPVVKVADGRLSTEVLETPLP
ncbi:MAG: diaminopimelate epimerase [Pirellulaceae bacterium]